MFSVNNFYDYLTHQYGWPNKNNINFVFAFEKNADRNAWNMVALCDNNAVLNRTNNFKNDKFYSRIYLMDQEPLNFELFDNSYQTLSNTVKKWFDQESCDFLCENLSKFKQIAYALSTFNYSIICHSELNSNNVKLLEHYGFISCYYFYHALISRDWFRHWKHYTNNYDENSLRFGLYARDASGTRKYRLNVLDDLSHISNQVYFKIQPVIQQQIKNQKVFEHWSQHDIVHSGDASAFVSLDDCKKFQIQIVLETLFDTEKIHLTEKIFKSVVMQQPFILFAGPGSLQYLKDYGFKTFESLWDESYDQIKDSNLRYQKIIDLILSLNNLSNQEFNNLIIKAKEIVDYNHRYFYSEEFEKILLDELHHNMNTALEEQNKRFLSFDRSMLLDQVDFLYQKTGKILPMTKVGILSILTHLKNTQPTVADQVIQKYGHLF